MASYNNLSSPTLHQSPSPLVFGGSLTCCTGGLSSNSTHIKLLQHPKRTIFTPSSPLHLKFSSHPTSIDSLSTPHQRSSLSRVTTTINQQHLITHQEAEHHKPVTSVSQKVRSLDSEFKSLTEPIDRVKRLLHYATLLPPFDESSRTSENRVSGCTAQVWLDVKMMDDDDYLKNGSTTMRFRVDSDSEITKGFCSCLIWLFDGARVDEVLSVSVDDLVEMNVVGFSSRVNSRVNAWNNVLIAMQQRTKALVDRHVDHLLLR